MHAVNLAHPADFEAWRSAARRMILADARPESVDWRVGGDAARRASAPTNCLR